MTGQNSIHEETTAAGEGASSLETVGDDHGFILIQTLTYLAYRKRLIAKVTGIAALTGLILGLLMPVLYTATTKIMPPQQSQSTASMLVSQLASGGAGSLASLAGGGLGLKNTNDIYIGLLNSRPIADAIVQKFDLMHVYGAKDMTAARTKLAGNTKIAAEKSGLVSISVTDKDRKRAAEIANAYAAQLRALTNTIAITEASQRRLFYEEQLKKAKEELLGAELSFQQVQQKKGVVELDAQAKALIGGLAGLQAQIAAKQVELRALRSYSTENNPSVQLAENQLSSMQQEANRMGDNNHSSAPSSLGLQDVASAGLDYLRAQHDLQYRQVLFDLLLKQYDVAKMDEAKDATVIQVVEPAIEPDRKSSPHRASIVILFAVWGALSSGLYLLLSNFVQRIPGMSQSLTNLKSALISRSWRIANERQPLRS